MALGWGDLYVPTHGRELLAVDASSGQVRWARATGQVMSPPAVSNGMLLAGTIDGDLVVLDTASGEELTRVSLGETVFHSPLVGDGLVYMVVDERAGSMLVALTPRVN